MRKLLNVTWVREKLSYCRSLWGPFLGIYMQHLKMCGKHQLCCFQPRPMGCFSTVAAAVTKQPKHINLMLWSPWIEQVKQVLSQQMYRTRHNSEDRRAEDCIKAVWTWNVGGSHYQGCFPQFSGDFASVVWCSLQLTISSYFHWEESGFLLCTVWSNMAVVCTEKTYISCLLTSEAEGVLAEGTETTSVARNISVSLSCLKQA